MTILLIGCNYGIMVNLMSEYMAQMPEQDQPELVGSLTSETTLPPVGWFNCAVDKATALGMLVGTVVALGISSDRYQAPYDPYKALQGSTASAAPFPSAEASPFTTVPSTETTATTASASPIPTVQAAPTPTPIPEAPAAVEAPKPAIEPGICAAPPKRMVLQNPDGRVLADVAVESFAGTFVGNNANGVPQYDIDPPVALVPGDNRAVYFSPAGVPNTEPSVLKDGQKIADQDKDTIVLSHATNYVDDPTKYKAFQFVSEATVGATARVWTDCGQFTYTLTTSEDLWMVSKPELAADTRTWGGNERLLKIITCVPGLGLDESQQQNTVLRLQMTAASLNQ